jgi:hypothetical protein
MNHTVAVIVLNMITVAIIGGCIAGLVLLFRAAFGRRPRRRDIAPCGNLRCKDCYPNVKARR